MWHGVFTCTYLVYLTFLNYQVVNLSASIFKQLQTRYSLNNLNNKKTSQRFLDQQFLQDFTQKQLKYSAIKLYCFYFKIKLYHMFSLNLSSTLQIGMLILSYIVLITQTN